MSGGGDPGHDTPERERAAAAIAQLPVPAPAAGTELFGVTPGSGYREPPSLARRADGQTIQLTPLLYTVLESIDGVRTYEQIAAHVSERIGRTASPKDIVFLIETKLRPLGFLRAPDGSEPALPRANPLLALRCRLVITNPEVTRRITRPFAALFRPSIVLLVLAAFVWTTWYALFEQGLASSIHQAFYEPHLLLLVFGLTLVSAGFHEFGHAAACRYGGATPGAMGFGLYLIWPAFYTDVTDSYRLGRGGRLRVDLGGLYFNAVFAVATFAVWIWLQADPLLLLIAAQLLQMSRQLAPLVRFDGYHILADLIGVPDLFAHIKPTLLGLLPTRWRGSQHHALKPWARTVVTLWVLVVVPLLAVLLVTLVMIAPRLAATAWDALGVQWETLATNWADRELAHVGLRILSIISLALPVLTVSYLLVRVARRTAISLWKASAGSRWKRRGVIALGLVTLAGLAWFWLPQGQYTPIAAEERGTLPRLVAPSTVPAGESAPVAPPAATTGGGATVQAPPPVPGTSTPSVGLVLVPRTEDGGPTAAQPLRIVHRGGNDRVPITVVEPAEPAAPADDRGDWPFPWHSPPPVSEGDNRAMVVNTEDGSTVYDIALAFVWVTDGGPVDERNEAFAYASCRDCTSVAVAFQVVLIVGQANVVTPVNTAVAANYGCESCRTHAVAVQLTATLVEAPSEEVLAQLGAVWAELEQLESVAESLTLEQIYTWLKHAESQILTILANAGTEGAAATEAVAVGDGEGEDQLSDGAHDSSADGTDDPDAVHGPDEGDGSDVGDGPVEGDDPSAQEPSPSPSPSPSPDPTEPTDTTTDDVATEPTDPVEEPASDPEATSGSDPEPEVASDPEGDTGSSTTDP